MPSISDSRRSSRNVKLLVYDVPGQGQVEESVGPDRIVDRFWSLVGGSPADAGVPPDAPTA